MFLPVSSFLILAAAQSANSATSLPIEKGIWSQRPCETAQGIFIYDGVRFGSIWYNGNSHDTPSQSSISEIAGISRRTGGYVTFKFRDTEKDPVSLTSTGADRMAVYVSKQFSKPHRRCRYSSLPAKIRSAVRMHAPQLADTKTMKMPPSSGRLGIPSGFYVNHALPCWVEHSEIFFYDGKRFGWVGANGFRKAEMFPVVSALKQNGKWKLTSRGETLKIIGEGKIFIDGRGGGWSKWCAVNEVRADPVIPPRRR